MADLKLVYRADNEQIALDELEKLKEKWNKKYPMVISSWQNNGLSSPLILNIRRASVN